MCLSGQTRWVGKEKDRFQGALSCPGLRYPYKAWVKFLKTRVQPNTTTTLNVRDMVTLTRMQEAGRIPWVQLIFNKLCTISRTKQVVPTMPDNIWRILERAGVPMDSYALNFGLEQYC